MTAKLAAVPLPARVQSGFAQIFTSIDSLERLELVVADLASAATDDELMDGRVYAEQLGKTAWKIQIILDAEIWNRHEKLLGGRGNKDEQEKGILKAVDKHAHRLGCSSRTVQRNAQIFRRFKTVVLADNTLEKKEYFKAALSASNPEAAIEHFAEERSKNPFYRPADAWRWVKAEGKPKSDKKPISLHSVQRSALVHHIESVAMPAILDLKTKCPNPQFVTRFYSQWYQDLKDAKEEIEREDFSESLASAWRKGNHTTADLARATGQQVAYVASVLHDLEDADPAIFERVERGGETDQARGKNETLWHLVGEPVGSNFSSPRMRSVYQPGD